MSQLVDLIKGNPRFAAVMVQRAEEHLGTRAGKIESDSFKEAVENQYPAADETVEHDKDLKKMIRVYEKAEDETVEVHVNDTVYNYL